MCKTIIICLLAAAVIIGLRLLLSGPGRGKAPKGGGSVDGTTGPNSTASAEGTHPDTVSDESAEAQDDPVTMTDGDGCVPLDESPSDIEVAAEGGSGGDTPRETLASLMRSGMTVLAEDGRPLTLEDVLSMEGRAERVIPDGKRVPWTDPEPERQRKKTHAKSAGRKTSAKEDSGREEGK